MPVPDAGMGQMLPQVAQLVGSRVRSLQPFGQLVWPPGQVAQSVPVELQPFRHWIVDERHVPFAVHIPCVVTVPFTHDWAAPHSVPEPLVPVSMQTDIPVAHDVAPVLHWFVGWHGWFATHETQLPALHTRLVPQPVPSGWFAPLSEQTGVPVLQFSVPV